jgi:hypothetical protein
MALFWEKKLVFLGKIEFLDVKQRRKRLLSAALNPNNLDTVLKTKKNSARL